LSTSTDHIFQPFKTGSSSTSTPSPTSTLAVAAAAASNPFLNFSPGFPFPLGPGGIPSFAAAMGAAALKEENSHVAARLQIPGLPQGLPISTMMDLSSTQALLSNLARSVPNGFFPPSSSSQTPESLIPSVTISPVVPKPARGLTETSPLDLSGPSPPKRGRSDLVSPNHNDDGRVSTSPISSTSLVQPDPTLVTWSVAQVAAFVASIDICKDYSEVSNTQIIPLTCELVKTCG